MAVPRAPALAALLLLCCPGPATATVEAPDTQAFQVWSGPTRLGASEPHDATKCRDFYHDCCAAEPWDDGTVEKQACEAGFDAVPDPDCTLDTKGCKSFRGGIGCFQCLPANADKTKCSDDGQDCCAHSSWGESQTCSDGYQAVPGPCSDSNPGCNKFADGIGCYTCFPPTEDVTVYTVNQSITMEISGSTEDVESVLKGVLADAFSPGGDGTGHPQDPGLRVSEVAGAPKTQTARTFKYTYSTNSEDIYKRLTDPDFDTGFWINVLMTDPAEGPTPRLSNASSVVYSPGPLSVSPMGAKIFDTKPGPPPAPRAAAKGDPHLENMYGERFDLMRPGTYVLLQIPSGTDTLDSFLRVVGKVQRFGQLCAHTYFQELNITGTWVQATQSILQFRAGENGGSEPSKWMTFGDVDLKVVQGHDAVGISYLNLFVRHLGRTSVKVGGLLGADDHTDAAKPDEHCTSRVVLETLDETGLSETDAPRTSSLSTAVASMA